MIKRVAILAINHKDYDTEKRSYFMRNKGVIEFVCFTSENFINWRAYRVDELVVTHQFLASNKPNKQHLINEAMTIRDSRT